MAVTRNDVARLAGVSPAVVSFVINNGPRPVSEETRQRVLAAIKELGYRPNTIARSLRLRRSNTIGMIVFDISNVYYSEVAKGVQDLADSYGYTVILANTHGSADAQTACVENLVSRQVEGIIFITLPVVARELEMLETFSIIPVYIDPEGDLEEEIISRIRYISVDSEGGGYHVGRYLLEKGHRNLACITGKRLLAQNTDWRWRRQVGFERALNEADIVSTVIYTGEHSEDGYQAAYDLLKSANRPTAIFTGNDLLAIGVMRAALDLGLKIPSDLAVCGFDDIDMARYTFPRLTTVRIEKYKLGQQAFKMLLASQPQSTPDSQPGKGERFHYHFQTELIIRESA